MSKPILSVTLESNQGRKKAVQAVFDTGSFYTIVRRDALPRGIAIDLFPSPRRLGLAARGRKFEVIGSSAVSIQIEKKKVRDDVWVSEDLAREMLIGAGTMQKWDISILHENGKTRVHVGRDIRDPEINELL